jgi:hypothetical protein
MHAFDGIEEIQGINVERRQKGQIFKTALRTIRRKRPGTPSSPTVKAEKTLSAI